MKTETKKILVWLSWWVDSAVAAYLLKQEGYDVTAGFMINYLAPEGQYCPTREDREVAKQVAEFLDIPFFIFDYRDEYEEKVLDYMFEGYKKGITPNPDIMCNSEIKFKIFLDEALSLGFDMIATWHYAQIVRDQRIYRLLKWTDTHKDQSYFLAWLSKDQLSRALFPIGHMQKSDVRKLALRIGLPNAQRKDSQGICFVGKVRMEEFLSKKIPHKTGKVIDTSGNILWEHKGVYYYTIGQRKGLDIGGQKEPIFILEKDIDTNTIIVWYGDDTDLYKKKLWVRDIHFLSVAPDALQEENGLYRSSAKIRYRQKDQDCIIEKKWGFYEVSFDTPQRAIAPGQVIAFYDGDELWGSGVIV